MQSLSSLQHIIAASIDYELTWCVHGWQEAFRCDWNRDPNLIVCYLPDAPCRLTVKEKKVVKEIVGVPGDTFILPAGTNHQFESPACFTSGINIQYTLFDSIDILDLYRVPLRVSASPAADIGECIGRIVEAVGEMPEPGSVRVDDDFDLVAVAQEREYAFQLLGRVLQLSEMRPKGKERLLVLRKLKDSLRYLEENLTRKISIDTLAKIAGLSAHRFNAAFKDVIGDTPHQYILRRRVDKAMSLLSRSDAPVVEIAEQLGFHDQPHFTRLFKSLTGVSPSYYRKNFHRRFSSSLER